MIVCDKDKLDENRCNGAPDFIIEIVLPRNRRFTEYLNKKEKTCPYDIPFLFIRRRKKAIKECLLEQRIIAGIGNIYSDEILFAGKHGLNRSKNSVHCLICQADSPGKAFSE
jgi:hypothetical protein